jgi:hypothetical protein
MLVYARHLPSGQQNSLLAQAKPRPLVFDPPGILRDSASKFAYQEPQHLNTRGHQHD